MLEISVRRLSNSYDVIPLMISERLIDVTRDYRGETIAVSGSSAPITGMRKEKSAGAVGICAELEFVEEEPESSRTNQIFWKATYGRCRYVRKRR